MDSETMQEPIQEENTFPFDPVYPHKSAYEAYKLLINQIAEQLVEEDLGKIRHFCDLPSTATSPKSLDLLKLLEKKGRFSHANIDPLKELLRDIDRCDLVNQFVDPFKFQYGSSVFVEECSNRSSQSLPPGNLCERFNPSDTALQTANFSGIQSEKKSWPYPTHAHPSSKRHRSRYSLRPSSRPPLGSVTESPFPPHLTDAIPPGLSQPRARATGSTGTPSNSMFEGRADREYWLRRQRASGSPMSLSSSVYSRTPSLPSNSLYLTHSGREYAERSELALHRQPRAESMVPQHGSSFQPADTSVVQSTSSISRNGKRPSPPMPIPGRTSHWHTSPAPSPQQVPVAIERQPSQDRPRKAPIGQQTTSLSRKEMVNCIRDHRYDKYIRVRHRLGLNLGCKRNPQLRFKVWPCGLRDDEDECVTFQADVYFPAKCSAAVVKSKIKLTVTATDNQTGDQINSHSKEFSLGSRTITVYNLIQHAALIRSKSVTIGLTVEAEVLEFHPQLESETEFNIEEVQSPMAEYQQEDVENLFNINPHPESRPIPETEMQ